MPADVIDTLVRVVPGSRIDTLRRRRPVTRQHAQGSWLALFQPQVLGDVPLKERYAVAFFVAALSQDDNATDFYRAGLLREGGGDWLPALAEAVATGATKGPYGRWANHANLVAEGTDGPRFEVAEPLRAGLGAKLSAALDHAHLLVFRPREAGRRDLEALLADGWSESGIVTLSQLVAFLSFQLRVAAGLRLLQESFK